MHLPSIVCGLAARRPRPFPPALADEERDDDDQEDDEDDGDEDAGDDSDLLGERVVDGRQHDLVHLDEDGCAALVDDVLPVEVELRGDARDDRVVVAQRGAVLDRVVDVGRVVVPHRHDLRLGREVDLGFGRLGPAQLRGREPAGGSATDL